MSERIDRLKAELAAHDAYMASTAFAKFIAARQEEVNQFNFDIAHTAANWDEVVALRATRDNTLQLVNTFEDTRDNLKTAIDEAVEEETKLATEGKR